MGSQVRKSSLLMKKEVKRKKRDVSEELNISEM